MPQNNVLVDDTHNARLYDFGRAKVIGDAEYSTALVAGCAPYMAPELFPEDERIVDQLFSPSSDIYAFGMLAFEVSEYLEATALRLLITLKDVYRRSAFQ